MSTGGTTMSDVVAAQLVRRRKAMGMTRDQLAERCRRAGLGSMTAAALANIETGRRDGAGRRRREVTVDELLAFGRALDVPPMALLVPLDDANIHELEPLAGWPLEPFRAYQWVTGEMTVRGGLPGDDDLRE